MVTLQQIEQASIAINGIEFQELCNEYFSTPFLVNGIRAETFIAILFCKRPRFVIFDIHSLFKFTKNTYSQLILDSLDYKNP